MSVERARRRLYQNGATPADVEHYLALGEVPPRQVVSPGRRRAVHRVVVVIGALTAIAAAFGTGMSVGSLGSGARSASSSMADLIGGSDTRQVVAASNVLDGETPLQASGLDADARVVLVVRCPARDGELRISATPVGRLSGTAVLRGRCRGVSSYPLPSSSGTMIQVLITPAHPATFEAVLLQRSEAEREADDDE